MTAGVSPLSSSDTEQEDEIDAEGRAATLPTSDGNLVLRDPPVFTAPYGFRRADYDEAAVSEFDLESVTADDVELWLVRAPENIKLKHLDGLAVPKPGSSTSFRARKTRYQLGDANFKDDMESMTAFLPCQTRGNRLLRARIPFSRKLAVVLAPDVEEPADHLEEAPLSEAQRHPQPKFRYRFGAPGASIQPDEVTEIRKDDTRPKKKHKVVN